MSHKILACAGALVGLMHATDRCRDANLFQCSRDRAFDPSISPCGSWWLHSTACMQLYMQGSVSRSRGWARRATGETIRSTFYSDKPEASKHVHESTRLARLPGAQDGIIEGRRAGCAAACGLVRPWTQRTRPMHSVAHRSLRACTDGHAPRPERSEDDDDLLFSPQCSVFTPSPCTVPRVSWLTEEAAPYFQHFALFSVALWLREHACYDICWSGQLSPLQIILPLQTRAQLSRMHACPHDSCVACRHAVRLFRAIVRAAVSEAELFWLAEGWRLKTTTPESWSACPLSL